MLLTQIGPGGAGSRRRWQNPKVIFPGPSDKKAFGPGPVSPTSSARLPCRHRRHSAVISLLLEEGPTPTCRNFPEQEHRLAAITAPAGFNRMAAGIENTPV